MTYEEFVKHYTKSSDPASRFMTDVTLDVAFYSGLVPFSRLPAHVQQDLLSTAETDDEVRDIIDRQRTEEAAHREGEQRVESWVQGKATSTEIAQEMLMRACFAEMVEVVSRPFPDKTRFFLTDDRTRGAYLAAFQDGLAKHGPEFTMVGWTEHVGSFVEIRFMPMQKGFTSSEAGESLRKIAGDHLIGVVCQQLHPEGVN